MIPTPSHPLNTFVRFIQLKSLRERTKESYVSWVKRLAQHCGVACASLLTQEEVLGFLHHLQKHHDYEGSTLNQCICALRLFFRDHLQHTDWTCWQQIRIKRSVPIPTVLSRDEVRLLLASVKEPRFVAVFSLLYHCGLRLGEVCRLEVTHLDRSRGLLRVINGKGGKNREVPVSPEMFERLGLWWRRHKNPRFLFPGIGRGWKEKYGCGLTALRLAQHPMSEASVQQALKAAILTSRLKKPGISCHALRHSYATHLLEEGVSVRQVQSYLGHSSIEITAKYLHLTTVSEAKAQDALRRLYAEIIPPAAVIGASVVGASAGKPRVATRR
jgi:integrase/recombinase XerD